MSFPLEVLKNTRKSLKKTLETLSLEQLNKTPEGHKNNIIWNIGHVLVTEQLLAYRLSGLPTMVSEEIIEKYKKGTAPAGDVSQNEVDDIKNLLEPTIEKTVKDYAKGAFVNFKEYTVSTTGNTLKNIEDALEFILFHEGMHMGIIMSLKKLV
ncbi:DinB family protein [Seonamhaeicola marinus]|uniref:DinB family protein n=1 Tax=Seonamhaeicola marinus TaxID=1912246 RepID=A0A5D0HRB8_9FLAO|nr:DinB family protein [Seonamhaeicola marinus]TYA73913.1 DinB family protein [Seonamhaeicola marinus]